MPQNPMTTRSGARTVVTGERLMEYDARRERARQKVKAMGHGAQMQIGFDMRRSAAAISNALIGRYIDTDVLADIERWLELNYPRFMRGRAN